MSRSYREPWYVCGYGTPSKRWLKRWANRMVRRAKDIPNGKAYRKCFDSWFICDWKYRWDPQPRYYWWSGELTVVEAEPEWRARRK